MTTILPSARVRVWLRHTALFGWGLLWLLPPANWTLHMFNDWMDFEMGARTLIHYRHMHIWATPALHLFVDHPHLQMGPPPLLLVAPFETLPPHGVAIGFALAMLAAGISAMAAVAAVARDLGFDSTGARRAALAAQVALVPVWAIEIGYWHHLDDMMAITAFAWACRFIARSGPWWLIGALLGTAVASKPWAVVATPVVLGLARRHRAPTVLVVLGTAAAWWAPFVLAAPATISSLGDYRTYPNEDSVLHLLGVAANGAGWLRPTQMLTGIAVAALAARRRTWVAAPLAGFAVRILLDPGGYSYYALAPLLAALLFDLTSTSRSRLRLRATIATLALVWLPSRIERPTPTAFGLLPSLHLSGVTPLCHLVWSLGAIGVLMWPRQRATEDTNQAVGQQSTSSRTTMSTPVLEEAQVGLRL